MITDTQAAVHQFYEQFANAFPDILLVDSETKFPYITYDYRTAEVMTSSLCTFQIWDRATHITRINEIADKISQAVPIVIGTIIKVNELGFLKITRGTPFIQSMPVNPDELDIVRCRGNLEIKHLI